MVRSHACTHTNTHTTPGGLLRANAIRSPFLRLVRRIVLGTALRFEPVKRRFIATVAEDTVSYANSSLAKSGAGSVSSGSSGSGNRAAAAKCAGTAFPDVSITVGGEVCPATDLLRGGAGCFGTLVLLTPSASTVGGGAGVGAGAGGGSNTEWPTHWGHWPLHVRSLARQGSASVDGSTAGSSKAAAAVDAWGLLAAAVGGADGVLVRPDTMIAVAGGPGEIRGWMQAHGFLPAVTTAPAGGGSNI